MHFSFYWLLKTIQSVNLEKPPVFVALKFQDK